MKVHLRCMIAGHVDAKQPENKNEGPSLMMTEEWGELRHGEM